MKRNYVISVPAKKFWTIIAPLALVCMFVAGLLGLLIVDKLVMPRIVKVDRGWVTVPDLQGLPFEQARQELYDVGLRLAVRDRVYHDDVPDNAVIFQEPEPGTRLDTQERRGISVVMSRGSESAPVPAILSLPEHQAKRMLKKQGFDIGSVSMKYSDEVPKDHVIKCDPQPGIVTSRDFAVGLVVSKGPEPTHAVVPNLVGEMLSEAKTYLQDAGLTAGTIKHQINTTSLPGSVISQSVAPGTSVPLKSSVDIVVSARKTR